MTLYINNNEQDAELISLAIGWDEADELVFAERVPHHLASFGVEDNVVLEAEGAVRFLGRIKRVSCQGVPGAERVVYTCRGLRELARQVYVRSAAGSPRVVFNAPETDEDYDAAFASKTAGDIIKWLFDTHADLLRAAGVIGAEPATGYVQAELDALTSVPPKLVFNCSNFDDALALVMSFQRAHRFIADPADQTFHFRAVLALEPKTITYNSADKPLSAVLEPTSAGRATAVEIVGPPRPVNNDVTLSDDGLTKTWDTELEADWTWEKCFAAENAETYGRVFRRFQIADESKRRMAQALASPQSLGPEALITPQVYRETFGSAWVRVAPVFDFADGIITLAQPATVGDETTAGDAECATDIRLIYAYLDDPLVARAPATGYEGTAFTEPANPVESVRYFYDEQFILPEQVSANEALAAQYLAATKDIVYAGAVELAQIDWSLASMAHRLNFTGRDDSGSPIATGFESLGAAPLSVRYQFADQRTEIALTTDAHEFLRVDSRLNEIETQARRNALHRAMQFGQAASRSGNDGQQGSDASGVHSIAVEGDTDSLSGRVTLEPGKRAKLTRKPGAKTIQIDALPGQWLWFFGRFYTSDAGTTIDLFASEQLFDVRWFPVLAGRLTKLIAYTPGTLSAGTVTILPSRKYIDGGGCPSTRIDHNTPSVALTSSANIASASGDEIEFDSLDVLALRATLSGDFAPNGYDLSVVAGAYFEENE